MSSAAPSAATCTSVLRPWPERYDRDKAPVATSSATRRGSKLGDLTPDAERRIPAGLVGDSPVVDSVQAGVDRWPRQYCRRCQRERQYESGIPEAVAPGARVLPRGGGLRAGRWSVSAPSRRLRPLGRASVRRQHRDQYYGGELGQGCQCCHCTACDRAGEHQKRGDQEQCYKGVVRVRLQGEGGVWVGGPAEGERCGQLLAGWAGADPHSQEDQQGKRGQVEEDGRAVGGREVVPTAGPGPDSLEGDVGVIVDRAVGVALGDVGGEVGVDRFAVGYATGADLTGVADVDHTGVGQVEPGPQPDQEQGGDQQPGRRPDRRQPLSPTAEADPQRPRQQVEERWVLKGDRDSDFAAVEPDVGDAEAEQDEEVEVGNATGTAPVEEPDQEERTER